jgi:hypothetical protein
MTPYRYDWGLRQEMYKISLHYLLVVESKEVAPPSSRHILIGRHEGRRRTLRR